MMQIITFIGIIAALITIFQFSIVVFAIIVALIIVGQISKKYHHQAFLPKIHSFIIKTLGIKIQASTNSPDYVNKLPERTHKTIGRSIELATITKALNAKKQVIAIISLGGMGKTTLVRQWLDNFREKPNHNDFKKIFAWSFYSQGSHNTQNSSAPFFAAALPFFGAERIPWQEQAKGKLLAELLFKEKVMLVLDGVEPLQNQVDVMGGLFKDFAMQSFLWEVKQQSCAGESVVLITSRQPIIELKGFKDFKAIDLEVLKPADGMDLLRNLGMKGNDKELQQLSKENNGYTLALVLLAKLLVKEFAGDIAARDQLPALPVGDTTHERHARRILQFYDEQYWDKQALERRFLYLLGLFDRPLGLSEKQVLFEKAEFAQPLAQLSLRRFRQIENNLVQANLLLKTELDWDCHPIVRQYFGQRFAEMQPTAFRKAHQVLFEFYQARPAQHQPETLAELEPLYRAVVHGCWAGAYQEALDEVYFERILRGSEAYSLHKLGAYSQDLTALAAFFPQGWSQPVQHDLSEADQAWLLGQASFCLMSLGRLAEAVEPRQADLKLREKLEDWKGAARTAQNLVDLLLPLGRLAEATAAAQQAIDYAQRAEYWLWEMAGNAYLATCYHRQGQLAEAAQAFETAEAIQAKDNSESPQLYSLAGFWYCALLLAQATQSAEIEQVLARGEYSLGIVKNLLSISLDQLTLARCYQALQRPTEAQAKFDQAVAAIREAGKIQYLSVFLIDRANFHLQQQKKQLAYRDLQEAEGIIQRGEMQLYAVDWHLAMCRYQQQQGDLDAAAEHRHNAERLIDATGYELQRPAA